MMATILIIFFRK